MPDLPEVPVIDLMLGIPDENFHEHYGFLKPQLRDDGSKTLVMPAGYMFKDVPVAGKRDDYIAYTLEQMDRHHIERAMIGVDPTRVRSDRWPVRPGSNRGRTSRRTIRARSPRAREVPRDGATDRRRLAPGRRPRRRRSRG